MYVDISLFMRMFLVSDKWVLVSIEKVNPT